jgi:hypothetical protein
METTTTTSSVIVALSIADVSTISAGLSSHTVRVPEISNI